MTKEDRIRKDLQFKAFRESETGRLFQRYTSALGHAWTKDATWEGSDASLRKTWEKADQARDDFLDHVCQLAGIVNPYTAK